MVSELVAVAWMHPTEGWVHHRRDEVAPHCQKDGPQPVPLYSATAIESLSRHLEEARDGDWLSRFTVDNINHAALDSAVGVLRTRLAGSKSYQAALWSAIVDYVERAHPRRAKETVSHA